MAKNVNNPKSEITRNSNSAIAIQAISSLVLIILLGFFLFGNFEYSLPGSNIKISSLNYWVMTDAQRELIKNKDRNEKALEDKKQEDNLSFTDRTVSLETNFGTLDIQLLDKTAPKTTENFIRLAYRNYFNDTVFHRIVKQPNFGVIQGGDPTATGSGGSSAFGSPFQDEIYKSVSATPTDTKTNETKPQEFVNSELYSDLKDGVVTYKKGYVAMANSGPNTNSSQFFIMLEDTKLPPAYTIFGKLTDKSLSTLDKINQEVKPIGETGDGKPDKEIKIINTKLN